MAGRIEARLEELGLTLPAAPAPAGSYVGTVISRGMLYISGQISSDESGLITGTLGSGVTVEQGAAAARRCGLSLIAQAKAALGDLDRVRRVVRVGGFVASAPGFHDQPKVVNGCSDLFAEVFGDAGRHTRAAVGVAALPLGVAVEIEAVFEIE